MLFERLEKYEGYTVTERKKKAYERKLNNQLAQYPLIAFHVAEGQKSLDDEFSQRVQSASKIEQARRDTIAKLWRRGRKLYYSLPSELKVLVKTQWLNWWGGRTSYNFWYVVENYSGEREKRLAALKKTQILHRESGVQIGL